jgi:hypothetical protein
MKPTHRYLLGASALLTWSLIVACSSEEAAAPSRPPVPPPNTSQPDGGGGEGGASDCFDTTKNTPVEQKDFFNQCTSAECFPFDNGARIEGYTAGAPLPSLD